MVTLREKPKSRGAFASFDGLPRVKADRKGSQKPTKDRRLLGLASSISVPRSGSLNSSQRVWKDDLDCLGAGSRLPNAREIVHTRTPGRVLSCTYRLLSVAGKRRTGGFSYCRCISPLSSSSSPEGNGMLEQRPGTVCTAYDGTSVWVSAAGGERSMQRSSSAWIVAAGTGTGAVRNDGELHAKP